MRMDNSKIRTLSVVVPCYNEQEVLPLIIPRLVTVLERLDFDAFEVLLVDDGSRDDTWELIEKAVWLDERLRGLRLSRNFGHQSAVSAGLARARGSYVVLIDADLQDPPELIEQMVVEADRGADVVYAVRRRRDGETRFKRVSAFIFYRVLKRLSGVDIPSDTGDFRLMKRKVVRALNNMPENDRFIRGMVAWVGFRQVGLAYDRSERAAGCTKYPFRQMFRFALDAISSFSVTPLRIATCLGGLTSLLAVFGVCYVLWVRLHTAAWTPGWANLAVTSLFLGGIQLMCIGVIGEYVGRVYIEGKRRPKYLFSQVSGVGLASRRPHRSESDNLRVLQHNVL